MDGIRSLRVGMKGLYKLPFTRGLAVVVTSVICLLPWSGQWCRFQCRSSKDCTCRALYSSLSSKLKPVTCRDSASPGPMQDVVTHLVRFKTITQIESYSADPSPSPSCSRTWRSSHTSRVTLGRLPTWTFAHPQRACLSLHRWQKTICN
jgi:hypothetical protein